MADVGVGIFGGGTGPIHFGVVYNGCSGSEYSLNDCSNLGTGGCNHNYDWGVRCDIGECIK